jgi:1-deoxy-D-xylulose-5-phosphate reductoisomerase
MKTVAVLGSTGSIGTQALEVVARHPDSLRVVSLAAGSRMDELARQVRAFHPGLVAVMGSAEASRLSGLLADLKDRPEIVSGPEGLRQAAGRDGTDSVLNGLVGAVGLIPTLTALRAGKEVLLANKESLVMAGEIIREILAGGHGKIVPVDSEHSAIFQCLGGHANGRGVSRIILTASGGPFWNRPIEEFASITLKEALSHPTWKMGPKITIDSATLMNKGLEIIEAHYLFGLPPEKIDVVIHPASIVHSLVEFCDGSLLAQLSHPTMEVPIQFALLGGERMPTTVKRLELDQIGHLDFFPPDNRRFPAPDLARAALASGGTSPAVLNAANEEAVGLFLSEKIGFADIASLVEDALSNHETGSATEESVFAADRWARERVKSAAAAKRCSC